jgi:hypothetical protein
MKRIVIATVLAFLMTGVGAAQAQAQAAGPAASVVGAGSGLLPAAFGPLAGDRIHVSLARSSGSAHGRFHILHVGKDGGVKAELSGVVDCVSISGATAYVTGTITHGRVTEAPEFDPAGQTAALTVVDDGTSDRAGMDLSFFGTPHSIAPCQSVYPYMAIDEGNFIVSE